MCINNRRYRILTIIIYMNRRNFAFDKRNFIALAVGVVLILVGFVLMAGSGSTEDTFNPDIFSFRRIVLAPIVCLVGFFGIVAAIMLRPAASADDEYPAETKDKA